MPKKIQKNSSAVNPTSKKTSSALLNLFQSTHNYISSLNNSKLFAGLMIITLNIASKFVTVKLSKTMEAYLKYTFSRQILIFTIAWMGTRDIYIALIISLVFMIFMDFLFNEESAFCCLPSEFTDYHVQLFHESPQTMGPQGQMPPTASAAGTNVSTPTSIPTKKDTDIISEEEVQQARTTLEKAKLQNTQLQYQSFYNNNA